MLLGELGLLLSIVEAGLHVQLPTLRQVGLRGVGVAILSSAVFPLPVAWGVGRAFGLRGTEARAVAVCMVPSATTVALLVLRRAKALNSATGQLVVAASACDDIVALICISELRALLTGTPAAFLEPVAAALGFVLGVGLLAVYVMPRVLLALLKQAPPRLVEKTALCALAAVVCALCCALEYSGSSYLLGCVPTCAAPPLPNCFALTLFPLGLSWAGCAFAPCRPSRTCGSAR
jgi:Kef-type K+ transport system membrane component KefB